MADRESSAKASRRILVVEDARLVAVRLERTLIELGYDVVDAVASGEEALQAVSERRPDLILMDVHLAGDIDGVETAAQIRDRFGLPVIYLTVDASDAALQRAKLTAPYSYLIKPVQDRELHAAIEMAFHRLTLENERRQAQEELARLLDRLEEQVQARTAELQQTNAQLRHEIVEHKLAEQEIQRRILQQEALNTVIAAATATTDLSELLEIALDQILNALKIEMGGIWVSSQATVRGLPPEMRDVMKQAASAIPFGIGRVDAVQDWQCVAADSELGTMCAIMERFGIRASLTVPLIAEGQPIGGLSCATSEPHRWNSEEIALVQGVGRQLGSAAERLRLLEQIQEQAQQRQQIMDVVPEGVLLLDVEYRVVLANPAGQRALVVLADGARVGDILVALGDQSLGELLDRSENGVWHEIKAGGRTFEVIARPVQIVLESVGWVLVTRDMTHERELQEHIRQQDRMAVIGQLSGGVAHDFNNILTVIQGYTAMALDNMSSGDPIRPDLEQVRMAAERAAALTRQLLIFSRKQVLQPKILDLNAVFANMQPMLQRLIGEHVELHTVLAPALGRVWADPGQIEQVIMNLAVNARDAMPQGGRLTISTEKVVLGQDSIEDDLDVEPGTYVMLSVSDTGVGMTQEVKLHIYEPFFTTKAIGQGTGLGLSTVYGIVKQSGGGIEIESEVGVGTTFRIYLPQAETAVEVQQARDIDEKIQRGVETILLVEDEDMVRRLAQRALERYGYHVLAARVPSQAVRFCREWRGTISLLLTDVVLPEMSGRALADELLRLNPDMKVLYISGYTNAALDKYGVLKAGLSFLEKPFMPAELVRQVSQVLAADRR
ncbi:MAG: response regulator [Anaerolineae bacterium]|nr:response regulator [Anaerolineae bacterium]